MIMRCMVQLELYLNNIRLGNQRTYVTGQMKFQFGHVIDGNTQSRKWLLKGLRLKIKSNLTDF